MSIVTLITSRTSFLSNIKTTLIIILRARSSQVIALAPNFDERSSAAVLALGTKPIDFLMDRLGMNPLCDAVNILCITRLLRRLRPYASLDYFINPGVPSTSAACRVYVPRLFALEEGLGFAFTTTDGAMSLKRLVLWLYMQRVSRADRVFFLNPDDQAALVASGVLLASTRFLLGDIGVDLVNWVPAPPALRPPTFSLVARQMRNKGKSILRIQHRWPSGATYRYAFLFWTITRALLPKAMLSRGWPRAFGNGSCHMPVQPWMAYTRLFVLPCQSALKTSWPLHAQLLRRRCQAAKKLWLTE